MFNYTEYRRKYYLKNKQKFREYNRKYQKKNRDKINKAHRDWLKKNPIDPVKKKKYIQKWRKNNSDKMKDQQLRYNYGISLVQYNYMLADQKESCAICKTHKSKLKKSLYVDHNHKTNKVRGLLCRKCNTKLGSFGDSIINLTEAINYLKKYE